MIDLKVNNDNFQCEVNEETTINDIVDQVIDKMGEDQILVMAQADNQDLDLDRQDAFLSSHAKEYQTLYLQFRTLKELAVEAIDSCDTYIDTLVQKIRGVTQLFHKAEIKEGEAHFGEIIDILDLYIQLMAGITRSIKENFNPSEELLKSISQQEVHLISTLRAMLPAKENNDLIMLCDLLEYELIENLTAWKENIIPKLQKLKTE